MNAPDTTTSEPAPSAWADGYREAIRDALTVCREIRDVVSDGAPGQPSNAAAACCGAIARIVTPPPRTQAETDVLAERAKQRAKWGDDHDDGHLDGDLSTAAAYIASPTGLAADVDPPDWAYRLDAEHDRRGRLVIASALIIAEIEHLDRAGGE